MSAIPLQVHQLFSFFLPTPQSILLLGQQLLVCVITHAIGISSISTVSYTQEGEQQPILNLVKLRNVTDISTYPTASMATP